MRVGPDLFLDFIFALRKSVTISLRLVQEIGNDHKVVAGFHNNSIDDFAFLYEMEPMLQGALLNLRYEVNGVYEHGGSPSMFSRDNIRQMELVWIPAKGVHEFDFSLRQDGDWLGIGKLGVFLRPEKEVYMDAWYYGVRSELLRLPLPLTA